MSCISILCYFLDLLYQVFGGVPILGNIIAAIGQEWCQD